MRHYGIVRLTKSLSSCDKRLEVAKRAGLSYRQFVAEPLM